MIRKYVIELEDTIKGFSENVEYLERVFGAEKLSTGYCPKCGVKMKEINIVTVDMRGNENDM